MPWGLPSSRPACVGAGQGVADWWGALKTEVSCYHHQRVDRVGVRLTVTARAADGTVEGLELTGHQGWFTAVQGHPEDTADQNPARQGLFDALIQAAHDRH